MGATIVSKYTFTPSSRYVFLTCASFEQRCVVIPEWVAANATTPPLAVYSFYSRSFAQYSSGHRDSITNLFDGNAQEIELRSSDPLYSADQFVECIESNYKKYGKVDFLIDSTTFTREWLFILFAIFKQYSDKVGEIIIAYNSAIGMSKKWLTRGAKDFRTVLGYSGDVYPSKKTHLVIILGHEFERANAIIEHCEPHILTIGIGAKDKSINDDMWQENVKYLERLKTCYSMKINEFTLDLGDPLSAKDDIANQLTQLDDFNTILAPLNTKMSSLGACLFALDNPSVQICYLQMELYNTLEYSEPSENIRFFKM